MQINKSLFLITLMSTTLTYHCNAMDKSTNTQNYAIPLNNGLLTEVSGIVSHTESGWLSSRHIKSTKIKTDTLINLIRYEKKLDPASKSGGPVELFCPILYRENGDCVAHLGQFNRKTHKEAMEAIRQNKALYCAIGQGALVYSLNKQPKAEICTYLKEKLEKILAEKNPIELIRS